MSSALAARIAGTALRIAAAAAISPAVLASGVAWASARCAVRARRPISAIRAAVSTGA
jgi:hypothetical protein